MSSSKGALALLMALSVGQSGVLAQAPASPPQDLVQKLETKLFSRNYDHDPMEKRVERLELLVFGAIQAGGLNERWQRINKVLADRERQDNQVTAAPGKAAAGSSTQAARAPANYPAVNSLEWRVLKKTYRQEPLNDRLARLEAKLLGQASPGLALSDRVERLKKIVGGAEAASRQAQPGPTATRPPVTGPMPRAYPRNIPDGGAPFAINPYLFRSPLGQRGMSPFSGNGGPFNEGSPFSGNGGPFNEGSPFSGNGSPFNDGSGAPFSFGTPQSPFESFGDMQGMSKMLTEMFDQMNRQMRDLRRLPPGSYSFKFAPEEDRSSPGGQGPDVYKYPPQAPFGNRHGNKPSQPAREPELPPYADPNSI